MKYKKEYTEFYVNGEHFKTTLSKKHEAQKKWERPKKGLVKAFIPGTVREIFVKRGNKVEKGQVLLILEAMKMKNRVKSPISGKVKSIKVRTNQVVAKNVLLLEIEQ